MHQEKWDFQNNEKQWNMIVTGWCYCYKQMLLTHPIDRENHEEKILSKNY
jgi:hypothetical protein